MIKCRNVTYRYRKDGEPVLKNINLEISAGEMVCIMGANGSGKSTLARMLAGLIKADKGEVMVNGQPAGDDSNSLTIGFLFQNPDNQMVAMVVDKEVAFALENQTIPLPVMERIVAETLEKYRISHLHNRLTSELSGGKSNGWLWLPRPFSVRPC
jgi:energy-coupling factor transporter ATP-binding protein EcfA2